MNQGNMVPRSDECWDANGHGWKLVSGEFNTGRVDSVAEVTGLNSDLQDRDGHDDDGSRVWWVTDRIWGRAGSLSQNAFGI